MTDLVRQNDVLIFRDLISHGTMRVNGGQYRVQTGILEFSRKRADHSGQRIAHPTDSLRGRTDWQLKDLVIMIDFGMVLFQDNGRIQLLNGFLIVFNGLIGNLDS